MRTFFPAKILLFGEHRVLRGAAALAVPYHGLGATWHAAAPTPAIFSDFQQYLQQHFTKDELNFQQLQQALTKGLQLHTSIPFGYGLGSSGALCAAFWDRFRTSSLATQSLLGLQQRFALMESFFHGKSSGIDPLISYLDQAFVLGGGALPSVCEMPTAWATGFFLLDTRITRHSNLLIQAFLDRYDTDAAWRRAAEAEWGTADSACQRALLEADWPTLAKQFRLLSEAQFSLASFLIPPSIQPLWRGQSYCLKVCGAGGGGFMLGYTTNWLQTQAELSDWSLRKL